MSRQGTKRNGDTNTIVDALLPIFGKTIGRDTFRARLTLVAKKAGYTGVGELTDYLSKPVQSRKAKSAEVIEHNGLKYKLMAKQ